MYINNIEKFNTKPLNEKFELVIDSKGIIVNVKA